jgi:hypothetical protein
MSWKNENIEITPDRDRKFIYKFYTDLFTTTNPESDLNKMIDKHFLLVKRLMSMTKNYMIKSQSDKVTSIYFQNIPLDLSSNNYLFMKFMKFHSGFLQFNESYGPGNFEKVEIDNNMLNDFIARQFYVCLNKSKTLFEGKNVSDYEMIKNTCVRERLTFFNFLSENGTSRRTARDFINSEYMKILKGYPRIPGLYEGTGKLKLNEIVEVYGV